MFFLDQNWSESSIHSEKTQEKNRLQTDARLLKAFAEPIVIQNKNWINATIISMITSIISILALLNLIQINFTVFRSIKSQWLHDREKRIKTSTKAIQIKNTELTFVMAMSLPSSQISILNLKIERCIIISMPMHYKFWNSEYFVFDYGKSNGKSLAIPINQRVVSYSNNVQCTMQIARKLKAHKHKHKMLKPWAQLLDDNNSNCFGRQKHWSDFLDKPISQNRFIVVRNNRWWCRTTHKNWTT